MTPAVVKKVEPCMLLEEKDAALFVVVTVVPVVFPVNVAVATLFSVLNACENESTKRKMMRTEMSGLIYEHAPPEEMPFQAVLL